MGWGSPPSPALSRSALRARDALVLEHLPLADAIASATARRLFPLVEREDLIQVAREALVRSAPRCRAGEAAEPYLRRCITGALQHHLRDLIVLPEDSVTPWIKPWIATAGSNLSLFTGQVDRGGNSILLELEMAPWAELGALLVQLAEAKKLDVSAKKGSRSVRFLRSLFGARQHGHAGPGRAVEVVDLSKKLSQRLSGLGADVALRRPDASQ